uniref:Putative terminase n=1 Tax=viral metagenome TaxID=1070528 RepID=A0A6M3KRD8_9ZZZZ
MNLDNKDQLKEVMAQCFLSTKTTAQMLFTDSFSRAFAPITDPIFAALDDDSLQKVVIKAPRGWGKSTILNIAYAGKKILFQEKKFIVPMSTTSTKAVLESENLKRELMTNTLIKKVFGNVKTNNANETGIDASFSKEMWIANGGTLVFPRGAGQQVRGVRWGKYRPDLIIVDDLEDPEAVDSEEQRKKLKQWFFADVLNSVDRSNASWKVVYIDTLKHQDSLLADLMNDNTWHHIDIDLCDDSLHSNWPAFMSDQAIKDLYESFRCQGLLDVFAREYRGQPIAKEDAIFKDSYFKYYLESDTDFTEKKGALDNIVIMDPAKTTKVSSDWSAIVGIGVNVELPRIYIRDIDAGMMHPDDVYARTFAMADRIGARTIGYEVTGLNEFITYPITTYMLKRGKFYNLVELKARGKKEDRIAMLNPLYRLGYIYHNKNISQLLESQLIAFPKSKRDDVMDATAYLVEMLELGERYFAADVNAQGEIPDVDEFEGLERENEPALKNWRAA